MIGRKAVVWALLLLAVLAACLGVAACGGGSSSSSSGGSNQDKIEAASSDKSTETEIMGTLSQKLGPLYEEAGVENTFKVPSGMCDIDEVITSEEQISLYSEDPSTLVSPNEDAAVSVGFFQGTDHGECLELIAEALEW